MYRLRLGSVRRSCALERSRGYNVTGIGETASGSGMGATERRFHVKKRVYLNRIGFSVGTVVVLEQIFRRLSRWQKEIGRCCQQKRFKPIFYLKRHIRLH